MNCQCKGDECDCYSLYFIGVPRGLWESKCSLDFLEIKRKNDFKHIIIRFGEWYESFFDDAKTLSLFTGIVASERKKGIFMCGFKASDLCQYEKQLKSRGWKIVEDYKN